MTSGRTALVVDDDDTLRLVAKKLLNRMGFSVELAANGEDAVSACQRQWFDLILMDLQMPNMDGLEATRLIRSADSGSLCATSIIVAVTASQVEKIALSAGMNDFLFKPVLSGNLTAMVNKWFPA